MASLNRAFSLSKVHRVAFGISQNLDLDVPGALQIFLQVDVAHSEGGLRLVTSGSERLRQLCRVLGDSHAAAPAAGGSLENDRVADAFGHVHRLLRIFHHPVRTG